MTAHQSILRRANTLARLGKYLEAIKLYQQVEAIDPVLLRIVEFNTRFCETMHAKANKKQLPPGSDYSMAALDLEQSRAYDFNKYLDVYKDLDREKVNPVLHYSTRGQLEGRRLFYTAQHLKKINQNPEAILPQLIERNKSKKTCEAAIILINLEPEAEIRNPERIYTDYDYIVAGLPPKRTDSDSIWSFRPIRYHLDNISKLELFIISNLAQHFSEYQHVVWISCAEYIDTREFDAAISQSEAAEHKITIAGSVKRITEMPKGDQINLFLSTIGIDPNNSCQSGLIAPNFISYKEMSRHDVSLMSRWWHFLAREDLGSLISLDILNMIGSQVLTEKTRIIKKAPVTSGQYASILNQKLSKRLGKKTVFSQSILSGLPRVAIIVPVFNAIDDVKRCLESVLASSYHNYNLIIADDASDNSTQRWLESFSNKHDRIVLLRSQTNRGYTININHAIKHCTGYDYIILLNSDTIVSGDWIQKLLQRFADDKYVGIAGPLSNKAGWQSFPLLRDENQIPNGMSLKQINQILEASNRNDLCPEVDIVNGFCICISNNVFDEIGLFDEISFPLGYGEEDDFCMRARFAGFKNVITLDTYVFHAKSKSMGHEKRLALATKGRTILDKRYQESHYRELTDSIGNNPIINVARSDFQATLSPCAEVVSIIGERVKHIEPGFSSLLASPPSIMVNLHCFYPDMCPYIAHYLKHIPFRHDLVITTSVDIGDDFFFRHLKSSKTESIKVLRVENRGRDVYPFYLALIDSDAVRSYDYVLHIHTKKSNHDPLLGVNWLSHLLSGLLHSRHYISNLLWTMSSEDIGLTFPEVLEQHFRSYKWGNNKDIAIRLAHDTGIDPKVLDRHFSFPAGFMFWARTKYLTKFTSLSIDSSSFPPEPIPIDGTLAHALERMITHFVEAESGKVNPIKPKNVLPFENELRYFSNRLLSADKIEAIITNAVVKRKSLSLIRYYDGEGAFFKADMWSEGYLNERMKYYFGLGEYTSDDAMAIRASILESIKRADIVGIPNVEIVREVISFAELYCAGDFEKMPKLKRRLNNQIDCSSAWRILSAFQLVLSSLSRAVDYTTKDIHYDLVRSGGIYRIIDAAKDVRLITSQPVAPLLNQIFGKDIIHYDIPARAFDMGAFPRTGHYPTHNVRLRKKLRSIDFTGALVLVGAGPLGKEYCSIIKDRGGIAIDIGAVFDSWINFLTRPEHANSDRQIAGELLLTSENVRCLTHMAVIPKAEIGIEHLPNAKKNPHVEKVLN